MGYHMTYYIVAHMVTLALIGLKKVIEFQYMTAALLTIKSITRKLGEGSEKT